MPELRFQATPKQWALIVVLGVALVAVLVLNQPADSAANATVAERRPLVSGRAVHTDGGCGTSRKRREEFLIRPGAWRETALEFVAET